MALTSVNDGPRSEINMTPMIDVLLVLLVIFMIVTPLTSHGIEALVPRPPDQVSPAPPANEIVITVAADRTLLLNQDLILREELKPRLARIFSLRPHGAVFIRGDRDLQFGDIAGIIDEARGAGVSRIALMGTL